ncbi:unnamed protein product [Urochloa humidicola]
MASTTAGSSSPPTPPHADDSLEPLLPGEKVYVAVRKEVAKDRTMLLWALHKFPHASFVLIHVYSPPKFIPFMGGKILAAHVEERQLAAFKGMDLQRVNDSLDQYIHLCGQGKIHAEKLVIESDDVAQGLVEFIWEHHVTALVMGAPSDRHYYTKKMKTLKSRKARFVEWKADPSCKIWFIHKGTLVHRSGPDFSLPRAKEELPLSAGKATAAVAILLLDKAFDYLGAGPFDYFGGSTEDVHKQRLLQKLHNSEAVFLKIERLLLKGQKHLGELCMMTSNIIWTFRNAVEEMEDAIDEIYYHKLEYRVCGSTSKFIMKKNYLLESLRNAVRSLDASASSLDYLYRRFHSESEIPNVPFYASQQERYPSWTTTGTVFGRDREKEQIVQWLTEDTVEHNPIAVYAVVGMAGMGKTTLVKIVREDPRVLVDFDFVVWVEVSVEFNVEAMTRVVLGSVSWMSCEYNTSMDVLQNSLTDKLRYRKLLLILDDVWEDNSVDKWEALLTPLRGCKRGSGILLTTRMQSVVDMAAVASGSAAKCLKMNELDEDNNLMLLKSQLPYHFDSEYYYDLLLIGEQIVKNIGGCPLVTSILARWLGSHMQIHHWITVLQKGWQHIEEKDIIIASFRLSYDYLPTELQACFRYCSLFPKGYKFN